MTALSPLRLPPELNYVGVFLSFACNLDCAYCINVPEQSGDRRQRYRGGRREMTPAEWRRALSRLPVREDLPITLQGGEPIVYGGGTGMREIVGGLGHRFDLLTNLGLSENRLAACFEGLRESFQRPAPYPSIRVSYHAREMDRQWQGRGAETLVERCLSLSELGYAVSPVKAETAVGIYVVDHPENHDLARLGRAADGHLHWETKEFLGRHGGSVFGTYLYPFCTDLLASGVWPQTLDCQCRTSELLIDPLGFVWRCHYFLYSAWTGRDPSTAFALLRRDGFDFTRAAAALSDMPYAPVGHILDPAFSMQTVRSFRLCNHYGNCIGCDTKVKNDRFQSLDDAARAHTSVEIRGIRMPETVLRRITDTDRARQLIDQGIIDPVADQCQTRLETAMEGRR